MNSNVNTAGASLPDEASFSASAISECARSAPAVSSPPAELSDAELLTATRRLVGRSNRLLASLLAHLAEVEARGIHRTRACSSLYTYCVYELRFSEDEAFRRVSAARLVRRFPVLLDAIAAGELHLTGLLMLAPHVTNENLVEVLARAKHRTKKEIARLVRMLDPLPDVPPRIDPLGSEPAQLVSSAPTWSHFVASMNPTRELAPRDRPLAWTEDTVEEPVSDRFQTLGGCALSEGSAPARLARDECTLSVGSPAARGGCALSEGSAPARGGCALSEGSAPARGGYALSEGSVPARLAPQRYKVQFTASEEYVALVEKAKALLSRSAPRAGLDEIHLRAMRALVAELERKRYAVTARPQQRARATSALAPPPPAAHQACKSIDGGQSAGEPEPALESARAAEPEPALESARAAEPEPALESARAAEPEPALESARVAGPELAHHADPGGPRRRGRYVPAGVRRAVFARDQGCCSYIGDAGQRCRETNGLELHHSRAFARGGEHSEENLTLRCRAHNTFAAEKDFGRDYIELARDSIEHEPWAKGEAARGGARPGLK
jgi:hypothetical protein